MIARIPRHDDLRDRSSTTAARGEPGWRGLDSGGAQAKESLRVFTWARQLFEDGATSGLLGELFLDGTKAHSPAPGRASADEIGERGKREIGRGSVTDFRPRCLRGDNVSCHHEEESRMIDEVERFLLFGENPEFSLFSFFFFFFLPRARLKNAGRHKNARPRLEVEGGKMKWGWRHICTLT